MRMAYRHTSLLYRCLGLFALLLLSACGGHLHHVVEPGETLHSIGFLYGYDYREIARWNGIGPPYQINAGQKLRVAPPDADAPPVQPAASRTPSRKASPAEVIPRTTDEPRRVETVAPRRPSTQKSGNYSYAGKTPHWRWPVKSPKVLRTFSANDPGRKGIALAGKRGDPVYAAAAGKVVYAGSGLVRYGQLIIIKHNEKYLSAYAHNDKLLVKEGDVVEAGQRVANIGSSGVQSPLLHFEIRRDGKPVNPLRYLPKR